MILEQYGFDENKNDWYMLIHEETERALRDDPRS